MTLPAKNASHVAEAAALLIEQFRSKRVIQAFLAGHMRQLQELEDVFWDIIDKRRLPSAAGVQLDTLGRMVREPRRGRLDAVYRNGIGVKIRVLRSKGRITDLIDIATLANAPAVPLGAENLRYLNFQVDVVSQVGERYLADYLSQARPAGSYGNLIASDLPYASLLTFDDANDPDATLQTFGDAVSGQGLLAASVYALPADLTGISLVGDPLLAAAPRIDYLSPASGTAGASVAIHGAYFTGATSVTVDGAGVAFTVVDDFTIDYTAPAHADGDVLVTVTTPGGAASATFTYGTGSPGELGGSGFADLAFGT